MLMVLNLHSFWGYDHSTGAIQAIDFFRESTSICAVNAFIIISGYFGIKWRFRGFFNLLFQVFFYSIVIYLVCIFLRIAVLDKEGVINSLKAVSSWGFIKCYIMLYFFSPLLNAFADKSDSRTILIFIFVFWIAENFVFLSNGFPNFCLVYMIGRLLRKTEAINTWKLNATKNYWVVTLLIFAISYSLFIFFHFDAGKMCNNIIAYSYSSPLVILQAVFLFMIFGKYKFENRFINWLASSCLAIYLIHMHPTIKEIGYYHITEILYEMPFYEHLILLVLIIGGVFFCSILVDKVRIWISSGCYNALVWSYNNSIGKNVIWKKIRL